MKEETGLTVRRPFVRGESIYTPLSLICRCGNPTKIYSGLYDENFCSEECLQKVHDKDRKEGVKHGKKKK